MMNFSRVIRTAAYLRPVQVYGQLKKRIVKPVYRAYRAPDGCQPLVWKKTIAKPACLKEGRLSFLNLEAPFTRWDETANGMLWAYNLNYMDWLVQDGMSWQEGAEWIDRFVAGMPENRVGLDPYPTALRGINWIKFISAFGNRIPTSKLESWKNSLYAQYRLLFRNLEYYLLGNHLLEDAFSLFVASVYFGDPKFYRKSSSLLLGQLREQILPDGAHFEQSPMYHCILLDRLLDCYNAASHNPRFEGQEKLSESLGRYCVRMLGHLESILYADGSFPKFNDSAEGIAPEPYKLFDYAKRLGLSWMAIPMKESGYRKMTGPRMEAFIDIGNIMAAYQPGHTHSDTFGYEVRIDGRPFIVDTGISTYDKTVRRQYERGTSAHNTVSIGGRNSSEVWSGFRVGRRAKVTLHAESDCEAIASHDGFGKSVPHRRQFRMDGGSFLVEDTVSVPAMSYIHLAPSVAVLSCSDSKIVTEFATIRISGAGRVEIADEFISETYNVFRNIKVIKIHFAGTLKYVVEPVSE